MDATTAMALGLLGVLWLVLLYFAFIQGEGPPQPLQLLSFLLWMGVSLALVYFFLVGVYKWNPNPLKVKIARRITDEKIIYLGDIVPGLYDLDYIRRIDTDQANEDSKEEWLAFYQYDVKENPEKKDHAGSACGSAGDYDGCRPPAILSYELIPASYDYLGQDAADVVVENIIPYQDPVSAYEDRPEVLINGSTRGVVTDLNIFRKTGVGLDCLQRQQWQSAHPGEAFPNPFRYQNIGSFRGSYQVTRSGATVTVIDSGGFERSQFVVKRQYRPKDGTYLHKDPDTNLLTPKESLVEESLDFGPGRPDQVTQVYYPEKAVLAFYLNLGPDDSKLEQAQSYLSPSAQGTYDIKTDLFGLSTDPNSPARARDRLARVLVWEIRYEPDVAAEQAHKEPV